VTLRISRRRQRDVGLDLGAVLAPQLLTHRPDASVVAQEGVERFGLGAVPEVGDAEREQLGTRVAEQVLGGLVDLGEAHRLEVEDEDGGGHLLEQRAVAVAHGVERAVRLDRRGEVLDVGDDVDRAGDRLDEPRGGDADPDHRTVAGDEPFLGHVAVALAAHQLLEQPQGRLVLLVGQPRDVDLAQLAEAAADHVEEGAVGVDQPAVGSGDRHRRQRLAEQLAEGGVAAPQLAPGLLALDGGEQAGGEHVGPCPTGDVVDDADREQLQEPLAGQLAAGEDHRRAVLPAQARREVQHRTRAGLVGAEENGVDSLFAQPFDDLRVVGACDLETVVAKGRVEGFRKRGLRWDPECDRRHDDLGARVALFNGCVNPKFLQRSRTADV